MPEKEVVARRFIELLIELPRKPVVLVPVPPDCQASALPAFNSPFLSARREYRSERSAGRGLPASSHEAGDSFPDHRMRRTAVQQSEERAVFVSEDAASRATRSSRRD